MQHNYIGANLMNQVNVLPALLTLVACDRPSLFGGHAEAFAFCTIRLQLDRQRKIELTHTSYYCQSRFVMRNFLALF